MALQQDKPPKTERAAGPPRVTRRQAAVVGGLVLAGVLFSFVTFSLATRAERRKEESSITQIASMERNDLSRRIDRSLETVSSIRSFYNASVEVERVEFTQFAEPALQNRPEILALGWLPRVAGPDRPKYVDMAHADGIRNFEITEERGAQTVVSPQRPEYYPLYFLESRQGAAGGLRQDLAVNPVHRQALERARDSGQATATRPIALVSQPGQPPGFFVFHPIYLKDVPLATVEQRRRSLQGLRVGHLPHRFTGGGRSIGKPEGAFEPAHLRRHQLGNSSAHVPA